MKRDKNTTDRLVKMWVDDLLLNPSKLLALPLSNHFNNLWKVNILSEFLSKETGITLCEANSRKHLTLPLIEKMDEMHIVVKGASSRENLIRQRILHWYSTLSFNDKKCLPRMITLPNNICFKSIGVEQASWIAQVTQYEWIANTIDEIHEDLFKLGIIKSDFKKVRERKQLVKDAKSIIVAWVSKVIKDEDSLWEIPISKANTPSGFNVAAGFIEETLGISYNTAYRHRQLTYPLIEEMIQKKILIDLDGSNEVQGVAIRRKLLNWYRKLSLEEKKLLPIFANKISLKRMPSEQCPIVRNDLRYAVVKNAWNFIHHDLKKLKIIDTNYKSVAERIEEKQVRQKEFNENKKERFCRLAKIPLNIAADFLDPSNIEPFIQVEQLFASQSNTVPAESGKDNYIYGCVLFIEFLSELYGTTPLRIATVFDEHLLSRFRKSLQQKIINDEISSTHANTILSSARRSLNRLTQLRDVKYCFFDINGFDPKRQTDVKKPFTKNERLQILEAIEKGLEESRSSLTPYKKTGIGKNPLDKNGARIRGLSTLENARWLFENPLKCKPVHYNTAKSPAEKAFLQIILESEKGLMEVYNEWGVNPMVSVDILVPYLLKLAQVTGLNADSILSLDIDDYIPSHKATSRPCLRYWKERSDGYKEYHLDLFKAELTWLTSTQAKAVNEIFEEICHLTSSFRQNIEDDALKNRLFIYVSHSTRKHGKVSPILGNEGKNVKTLGDSFARFVDKYSLKNDKGERLTLTISRFRPTFVSEMIDNGVSLREIQLMLGHSSIQTTIHYLDSLDFNSISRIKLNDKLKEIHQSTLDEKAEELTNKGNSKKDDQLVITFQTPLAGCKNIFDPPEFVKKLPSYTSGTPCSQYNKCLSCENVIIAVKNLPEIFAMQRDYTLLTEYTRVMDTPYGHVIRENLELIKNITDPQFSDFSIEELQDGQRLAEYIETTILVDGVV
ncbi:site-specific integrase [Acinetobacter sp. C_4_1]|uniref:site-specific integrase n=1 Tax=unclassified Acinetobacter TaxID=196816 RepID=UPI0021B80759|nr:MULTISPECIES: site-specific integrase [unclassified Acinetobacter]MCT8088730.1 site-specific integrase [Acinetobacter sp. F_3_1]MCT8096886.1 site-specific integrase [Acinetobacter sp. C_3_1]MCT8099761.1 site-specific integrase [Acinetobacter sp. C_4_1]MCT8133729.1 site-specific integrase [Acinetobacter sp. T_3_1]